MTTDLERLALALVDAGPEGLTRSAINALFRGHVSAERLDRLLAVLDEAGAVRRWYVPSPGRWATRWAPVDGAPIRWTADDVTAFWRRWLVLFLATPHVHLAPRDLACLCNEAGARGVALAHALEAVDRYRRGTPAPSIDAWRDVLKKALPVALADSARD